MSEGGGRGCSTEAVRHLFSRKDDQVQGRLSEGRVRGTTKLPPPVLREGVGDKYSCTRKEIGGVGEYRRDGEFQERGLNSISPIKVNPRSSRGSPSLGGTPPTPHSQVLPTA